MVSNILGGKLQFGLTMVINHSFVKVAGLDICVDSVKAGCLPALVTQNLDKVRLKSYCPFLATND